MFPKTVTAMTPRLGAMAGAAALLSGAGLAAGTAYASVVPDGLLPGPDVATLQQAAGPRPSIPDAPSASITASRGGMAGWKPVAAERLDDMRGGFDAGGLQISFGIDRAVIVNGALVAATSVSIPDVAKITVDQANRLASALTGTAISSATTSVNSALASNPVTAGAAGASSTTSAVAAAASAGTSAAAAGSAGASATTVASSVGSAAQTAGATPSSGAASVVTVPASTAAQAATAALSAAAGQVVSNGLLSVIQNGPGNAALLNGGLPSSAATVIQNTLNNQSIQSLVSIDASVNTLQAFRAQVAAGTLNSALLRAASMR